MSNSDFTKAKAKANAMGLPLYKSERTNKKYYTIYDGKEIHFGDKRYEDFTVHGDQARRNKFHTRFKGNPGYNRKTSPLYYAARILW